VGIKSPQELVEVLIYNPAGEVMEGSITTVYFQRRPSSSPSSCSSKVMWVTPPLSSGCNAGTTRRYALARGICAEQVVRIEELADGEEVWLSNGLRGFMRAVLRI
jgi:branched-subunit amino acid aminotransferase/4-amino-4-deoxychorismate lyase